MPFADESTPQKLDDGWPESEKGDCQVVQGPRLLYTICYWVRSCEEIRSKILRDQICRMREREGGCEGVTVWMCRCDIDVQMCGRVEVER